MLRKWGMTVLMLLIAPALAFAQNTGKIEGTVIDGDTGDPLPGASVALVGTQLGTITDIDGNYFIIGVPVGTYDVQASFVGYSSSVIASVEVSSGYTAQDIDFTLRAGVELDEIVVEYERPLIQKDAIGVPKIVSAEDIVNLPVRGVTAVASIQAGVVSQEGSNTLNIRGGRGSEVTFFIDGVKVVGSAALPQSAVQEQEMIIGNISARYGDAMSGIINITTKSGSPKFFGSFEGVTSESLDDFGYNLASMAIGGPLVGEKVNFFLAAEYTDETDRAPRAVGELRLDRDVLDQLDAFPVSLLGVDGEGNDVVIPVPASLAGGATVGSQYVDNSGNVVAVGGVIGFSDGTTISAPEGTVISNPEMVESAGRIDPALFKLDESKRGAGYNRLALNGNLTFNLIENVRIRVGGRYVGEETTDMQSTRSSVFAPDPVQVRPRTDVQFFTTWTHYLSNSTFYQLQVDYTDRTGKNYDPRFGDSFDDILRYGDFEDEAYATIRGYKNVRFDAETRIDDHGTPDDATDDTEFTVQIPRYEFRYDDGSFPNSETIASLVSPSGGLGPASRLFRFHNTQLRVNAMATTQIGIHQLEFGGEFEKQTIRNHEVNGFSISRFVADADGPESLATGETGFTSYDQLTWTQLESRVGYVGYNFRGTKEVDDENLDAYVTDNTADFGDAAYNVAPHEPIYYGGYVQDKIEFRDIVLNLGVRVDVFDNNTRVLFDKFSRLPIVRAGEAGLASGAIGEDFAVYYNSGAVEGFRDLEGNFYNTNGEIVQAGEILLSGASPQSKGNLVTEEVFRDYEPQVTVMPRIGVSFPVTDQALFFARYGVVAQRPSSNNFTSLAGMSRTSGRINNNGLEPEKTIEYELGFRQRLSTRSALTISGFFRQIKNLIQLEDITTARPIPYSSYQNRDFGTVKGFEFDFDLRRTNNVSLNANYTLSFAKGTGSSSTTTSTIVWINETPPNFISPLDFDQRHNLNLSVDYRLGKGQGPTVGGVKLLENFGVNVLAVGKSGLPYTPQVEPFSVIESKAPIPSGGINSDRTPWTTRIDLRIDRKFAVGDRTNLSAFIWVQNLLDADNVFGVWRATGLPDDDGFLSTPGGATFLSGSLPVAEELYRHRTRNLGNFGIPRLTRVGVRLDF